MDISEVIDDLRQRIDQSRDWLKAKPDPLKGLKFRTENLWTAEPIDFLDDPRRVERHGVGFVFSLDDPDRDVKGRLNVRIKPDLTPDAEINETPYVVVYVVDQATGADETIKWFHIEIPASYEPLAELSIDEWYRHWINRALEQGKSGKILGPEMKLSS